ncbi:restriction endonuclease subunit S [Clostridium chauvoei]|uniref:restriction endonuclease subunit S n=4 Tax=Clostridium chauvoei TaxID=46867 RepID=UPI001C84C218|nr:restriction endonuclease subunit S [Clostridium chauvoei]MBX7282687.1 restriction endonuclease subunit S [Clostridium chauvoei]MBX7315421.1 restriction endonuclease subunit S [Clostridium chauvoei]MBX7360660.1 restriction endonuclease subunit S [Clostridium chauvoei]MBX7370854.1 restriction endonuclease subunit S [Clostridium chauvoei]MBX7373381.1 restriction endonuclease subunit S [Clostridium chauvoei]
MEYKKLNELCEINIGKTPSRSKSQYWGEGINWLSISDLKDKFIRKTREQITNEAISECNMKIVPKDTVVMSFKLSIGKTAILKEDMYTNEAIANFPIKNKELFPEYLYYAIKTLNFDNTDRAVMGATLNKTKLNQLRIPYCKLEEQKKIVEILDKAQELIDKRKEQIQALDELVKSQFIEMFGDPVSNPKGWKKVICKDITSKIGSGATPSGGNSSYKEEGISLIRSMNVHNNKFIYKDLAFIDDEQAKKLKNVIIEENDILLNITGASVARSCIVPSAIIPARVNQHVSIIRCKHEEILPVFLVYQFTNESYQRKLWDIATSGGATREAITKQQLENLELIVPPIEIQNKFIEFIKVNDKLKFEMENSLKELEDNFNSLMQKAFNGELFSE